MAELADYFQQETNIADCAIRRFGGQLGDRIAAHIQPLQFDQPADRCRQPGQLIRKKQQIDQFRQLPNLIRQSNEQIAGQVEFLQTVEVSDRLRYPFDLIVGKIQDPQSPQLKNRCSHTLKTVVVGNQNRRFSSRKTLWQRLQFICSNIDRFKLRQQADIDGSFAAHCSRLPDGEEMSICRLPAAAFAIGCHSIAMSAADSAGKRKQARSPDSAG
jgi:hypothetical protein